VTKSSYYLLLKTDNYLELTKRVEANQTNIGYIPRDYSAEKTYRIIVNGDNIKVYVNNNLEFDVTDDSLPRGSIAFKPLNAHASFDDVRVRKFTFPEPTVVAVGPEEIRNEGIPVPVYFLIGVAILVILLIVGISRKGKGSESSEPKLPLAELPKPELHINVTADAGFKVGVWEKLHATIMNAGEGIARNVKLTLSGPIEIGGVKTIPKLESGAKKETIIWIKPTEHGNLPLEVSIAYTDENGATFEINDFAYINVAKEDETVSVQPRTIFNYIAGGDIISGSKTGDVGMIKGGVSSIKKAPFGCKSIVAMAKHWMVPIR